EEIAPVSATFVTSQRDGAGGTGGRKTVPGMAPAKVEQRPNGNARDAPPHRGGESSAESRGPSREASRASTPVQATAARNGTQASAEDVEKHGALMRKVAEAVGSENKIMSFKSVVRGYRGSELSASDLVDTLWHMLDNDIDVAGPIITGLADLFVSEKRSQLLSAWQDLRVEVRPLFLPSSLPILFLTSPLHLPQQNQFPSLAPLGPTLNGVPTSTHPTQRSLNNRAQRDPAIWARVEQAANATQSRPTPRPPAFPALPVVGLTPRSNATRSTPWASSGPGSNPLPAPTPVQARPQPRSTPGTSNGAGRPAVKLAEFPSLPSSSVEADRRARMKAALTKPVERAPEVGWTGSYSGTSTRSGSPVE
ncbi:hypothetical protein P7C70_g9554, partial [Phenoliferia sp. Uapishka_3]